MTTIFTSRPSAATSYRRLTPPGFTISPLCGWEDHEDERDKYVVLTVHAPDTKTFAELDERVKPVVRDTWAGRMIPFPILLDADSKIQQTFGVSHWPTTLLFARSVGVAKSLHKLADRCV